MFLRVVVWSFASIYVGFNYDEFVMKVLRDGRWNEQDAALLVPGDIISIKLGDIIPADARLLEGDPLKIDQVGLLLLRVYCCTMYIIIGFIEF